MRLIRTAYLLAQKEIGVTEVPGPKANSRILDYFTAVVLNDEMSSSDETPWCSAFVNWCIQRAGGKGTRMANARSWLDWGLVSEGNEGDVVVFKRGNNSWQGHVAFLVSKGPIFITCLGGNQSNKVCISKYLRINVLGYRTSKD